MKKIIINTPFAVPSLVIIVFILFLTLVPEPIGKHEIRLFPGADKIVHFIMFFVAGCVFILDYAKKCYPRHVPLNIVIAITIFGIFFGGIIEILQDAMSLGRSMEILDFIFDSIGVISAFFVCYFYLIYKFRAFLKKSLSPSN